MHTHSLHLFDTAPLCILALRCILLHTQTWKRRRNHCLPPTRLECIQCTHFQHHISQTRHPLFQSSSSIHCGNNVFPCHVFLRCLHLGRLNSHEVRAAIIKKKIIVITLGDPDLATNQLDASALCLSLVSARTLTRVDPSLFQATIFSLNGTLLPRSTAPRSQRRSDLQGERSMKTAHA